MSAPVIWIIVPGAAAAVLYLFQRRQRLVIASGVILAILLAVLAWQTPIGETWRFGPFALKISDTLIVLGRRFVILDTDRPVLILIYSSIAFWFGGAGIADAGRPFVPLGLGIAALLTAALSVDPFLYAALLIEMAVLLAVPLLIDFGQEINRGVLRFLTFQTFGVPFILFTGWLLTGVEANPSTAPQALQAEIFLGLGFAFFLGIFPFHTWIPMLAERAHPYAAAFVFYMIPLGISFLGLHFLGRYSWLAAVPSLPSLLQVAGVLMVLVGGGWAAFQNDLGRMMGFAMVAEIGLVLLATSLGISAGGLTSLIGIFFALILPRGLGLGIWSLSLQALRRESGDLRFRSVQGSARRFPVASTGLLLANLSFAGFPLLAGFPVRLALLEGLAGQAPAIAAASLVGIVGLFVGVTRTMAVLLANADLNQGEVLETWGERIFLILGVFGLALIGVFPQIVMPWLAGLAGLFGQTRP